MASNSSTVVGAKSRRLLRQGTLIIPKTGERAKRSFTLHDPSLFVPSSGLTAEDDHDADEETPLLPRTAVNVAKSWVWHRFDYVKNLIKQFFAFFITDTGKDVLKCSLAYLIATLPVFIKSSAVILGKNDGKHLVANIVVWFHPARSEGSMHYGTILAFIAFVYATVISYAAMSISAFFKSQDALLAGHIVVLIVFCGGALGFLAWVKQTLSDLLVNVSVSLAAMVIATVLTKEGAIQDGEFSHDSVSQTLKMMLISIIISTVINLLVWPKFARKVLRGSLIQSTRSFAGMLVAITSGFLSGAEEDMKDPAVTALSEKFKSSVDSLDQQLSEAKFERYLLGKEKVFHLEERLVSTAKQLSQDIGGLRSAAATQFSLLAETSAKVVMPQFNQEGSSIGLESSHMFLEPPILDRIDEVSESSSHASDSESSIHNPSKMRKEGEGIGPTAATPAEIFTTFLDYLGPPMKSLVFTIKEILKELPFGPAPKFRISIDPQFRPSLVDAIKLFSNKRREALRLVYMSKSMTEARSIEVAADFEEVAASCGHFSSSLQDVAETCVDYLDILEEFELEVNEKRSRSWNWLRFWQRHSQTQDNDEHNARRNSSGNSGHRSSIAQIESRTNKGIPDPQNRPLTIDKSKPATEQPFPYWIWPYMRCFRREDIRFAIKVGIGAIALAVLSYIPKTAPYFHEWRLEWALTAYMFVCAMTVGAANTTSLARFKGTCIGAILAILVWVISDDNPYLLAFFGWLVSLGCFYIMLARGKGPMSRFILLTYNLSALYSYSLTINDGDDGRDDDEGGVDPWIWEITMHRVVAILVGIVWGIIITRGIWSIKARRKVQTGLSLLWLRMSLMWKQPPLSSLLEEEKKPSYMDVRDEAELRQFLTLLDQLRTGAESEFELRGPFPSATFSELLQSTSRMLDAFHALNVIISKDSKASPGEADILNCTVDERTQMAERLSHLLSVLASSIKMEYPLTGALPKIGHTRNRLLAKVFQYRRQENKRVEPTDEDYEIIYVYALVTAQIGAEIDTAGKVIDKLYGTLGEDVLKLQ